jgi:hypothetical protein
MEELIRSPLSEDATEGWPPEFIEEMSDGVVSDAPLAGLDAPRSADGRPVGPQPD